MGWQYGLNSVWNTKHIVNHARQKKTMVSFRGCLVLGGCLTIHIEKHFGSRQCWGFWNQDMHRRPKVQFSGRFPGASKRFRPWNSPATTPLVDTGQICAAIWLWYLWRTRFLKWWLSVCIWNTHLGWRNRYFYWWWCIPGFIDAVRNQSDGRVKDQKGWGSYC